LYTPNYFVEYKPIKTVLYLKMVNFSQAGDTFLVEKLLTNSKDKITVFKNRYEDN